MAELSKLPGLPENLPFERRVDILLVDDQPANLVALEAILQDLGHNLVLARSGDEALQRLLRDEFALVLLDVQMPGLDGFETAELIRGRKESRHTPIIFLTAFESDHFNVEKAYSLGAVDYLVKPLVPVIVRAKVSGFVDLFEKTRQVKRQAERIRQMERRDFEERLAAENARLRERVRLAAFGRDVAQALVRIDTLPAMLRHCAEALVRHLDGAFARIWIHNPAEGVLELQASAGLYTHLDGPHSRVPVGQYKIGLVAQERRPHLTNAVLDDPRVSDKAWAAREGMVAFAGYPLVVEDRLVGVMAMFARQALSDATLEAMASVADGIAMGVERKQAEAALRESEEKLRLMADTISQLAWMARPDGHIFWYNRGWYDYTGTTPSQMEGWGWQSVHDPAALPKVLENWKASIATGEPFEMVFPLRGADGRFRPFLTRVNPLRDEAGRILHWFGTNTDISEQKRAEDASRFLADASATLAAVVDYESTLQKVAGLAVPRVADWCAVDMVEADGSLRRLAVVHVDPAKVKLAQEVQRRYPPDPASPHGPPQVLRTGESDMVADIPDALLVQGARDEDHLRLVRELGLKSYMCVPLKGRGKVLGVVSFLSAESGRRYTEADLAFAEELASRSAIAIENARLYAELKEADRLKDEFLAMLAHELRNPLAPVRNALHIMKQPGANGAMVQQVRDMAERQVQHMARLLDDLLDVSRISRGRIELRKEAVDVAALISRTVEAVRPLVEERRHELTVALPAGPLRVEADPTRLEQVLTNLLNNAAKYTESGGHIWLTAEQGGGEIVLRVRDTGIGIEPEMLPRVFDLFVQVARRLDRSQGGVGIGLTLVKKLVELHGGRIEASSPGLGRGSEFAVRLPALRDKPRAEKTRASGEDKAAPLLRRRVLVVDDNQDAADSLAMLLRLAGQDVRAAYDGPSALTQANDFQPALVFLDIGMPGMDGYEVARRLRGESHLQGAVLVALTGWGQEEDRRRSTEAGFDHHLVKPVEPTALEELLADLKPAKG
jgi:PAS domain S-box-containing protein